MYGSRFSKKVPICSLSGVFHVNWQSRKNNNTDTHKKMTVMLYNTNILQFPIYEYSFYADYIYSHTNVNRTIFLSV